MKNLFWMIGLAFCLSPNFAHAHAQLLNSGEQALIGTESPIPRVDSDAIKNSQPCGPDGGKKAPTRAYVKGSTIQLHWKETINHTGVFRIDFSSDNDTTFTPLIADITDPQDVGVSPATPKMYNAQITLPDMVCDNCTLRLTQSMGPIDDNDDYFSCSDIRLVASAADLPRPTPTPSPDISNNSGSTDNSSTGKRELAKFDSKPFACGRIAGDHNDPSGPGPAILLLLALPLLILTSLRHPNFAPVKIKR